jgi:preprotein translocase subunit SecA
MEELRRSVSLRSYGQKDPLSEYKSEAFVFFEELMATLRSEICTSIFRTATNQGAFEKMFSKMSTQVELTGSDQGQAKAGALAGAMAMEAANSGGGQARAQKEVQLPKVEPIRRETAKIGRNDMVTIRKNGESKQLKYKRAEVFIENEGWVLDSNQ